MPVEVIILEEQLDTGRYRFRLHWHVRGRPARSMAPTAKEYMGVKAASIWSAGTVEELLHAIKAAELAIETCPGVQREQSLTAERRRCLRCGLWYGETHDPVKCEARVADLVRQSGLKEWMRRHNYKVVNWPETKLLAELDKKPDEEPKETANDNEPGVL